MRIATQVALMILVSFPVGATVKLTGFEFTAARVFRAFLALVLTSIVFGVKLVKATLRFCETTPYKVLKTGLMEQEVRPPSDAMYHALFFKWRVFGGCGEPQELAASLGWLSGEADVPHTSRTPPSAWLSGLAEAVAPRVRR